VIAADTSIVIAGFASWHELHDEARRVLDEKPRLPAHCAFEVYSVLTRLPAPHRALPGVVRDFLAERFEDDLLSLSSASQRALVLRLADLGISGGAAYDALVAATAAEAGATVKTCDRRARPTYERIGVDHVTVGF
jgi:predicted nucleic acid-binding protein